jgi:hypothetical protein
MIEGTPPDAEEQANPRTPGRIITFYSYKGGTGRSMALANVAWVLASNGKRVLTIDWDLEAPGLHRYFRPFLSDPEMAERPGLIDFFFDFLEAARFEGGERRSESHSDVPWYVEHADLLPYSASLEHDFPQEGLLDLVSAGQQGPSYGARVNSFQWTEFYERFGGGVFLEAVKTQLREHYDYILIDSRTGLSDTSGICTVQMPDELVVCFTLNRQSIFGAAATAVSADVQRRRADGTQGLRIWPVPTRVELAEKDRLEAARLLAREKFARCLWHVPAAKRTEYWGNIEVLYFPYYAYDEVLATIGDTPLQKASLLNAIERLTGYLTQGEIQRMPKWESGVREKLLAAYSLPRPTAPTIPSGQRKFFLSYSNSDSDASAVVRELGAALDRSFGKGSAFWDERIPLGAKWSETLAKNLESADTVISVVGKDWTLGAAKEETLRAVGMNKSVIPLLLPKLNFGVLPPLLAERRGMQLRGESLEEDVKEVVERLAEMPQPDEEVPIFGPSDPEDPQRGRWGGQSEANGRRLTAQVKDAGSAWFDAFLQVAPIDAVPLKGEVEFHLHPSFYPSVVRVPVVNGVAALKQRAWGAYTVGVSADEGQTRLELNLAELEDAPRLFRER